jgi:Sulfotransferase family
MEPAINGVATSRLHITDVVRCEHDCDVVLDADISQPAPNGTSETYALEVEGWAVGRDSPVAAIEFLHDDTRILSVPLIRARPDVAERFPDAPGNEQRGFYTAFNTLRFPTKFTIELVALLENGERGALGTLRGTRRELHLDNEPRFQPIVVTSLGRSGSSLLSRLLASHPDVLGYRPFEYEPRVATYWVDVLLELSSPKSYVEQIDTRAAIETKAWWIGDFADMQRTLGERLEPALATWFGTTRIQDLATMCRDRIDDVYERIGEISDKHVDHFVEKTLPTNSTSLLCEIYGEGREVILVRDFRDMVVSLLAYNKKLGEHGLGRDLVTCDAEYIQGPVRNSVLRLVRALDRRSGRSHVVRYEDLVLDPEDAMRKMLADLDLDNSDAAMRATFAAHERATPDWAQQHRTSASAQASIGRWRKDLTPELQALCEDMLGFGLVAFGYEL